MPCAAIFDLDGTLVDSAALHAESWRLLAAEIGTEVGDELFRRTFGRANRDIIPEILGEPVPDDVLARHSDRKEELFRALAGDALRPFPGATRLLAGLAEAGFGLAVGSSTPRANLDFVLPRLGLDRWITVSVGMEDVARHKPEPDTFLEAARRLGVEPGDCLVFEDAPAGIEAGRRAGMVTVAVTTHHPADCFAHADVVEAGLAAIRPADCRRWLNRRARGGRDAPAPN